jgi:hypothetical protein
MAWRAQHNDPGTSGDGDGERSYVVLQMPLPACPACAQNDSANDGEAGNKPRSGESGMGNASYHVEQRVWR